MSTLTHLFSAKRLRGVVFPNKVVISPMSQYSAVNGHVQEWHIQHIGGLARGGPGCVMVEVASVSPDGRGTAGDLGIWADSHAHGLSELARIIEVNGAVPAIQIGHAGRKASMQRPWEGGGPLALDPRSTSESWQTVAPSPLPVQDDWPTPASLERAGLSRIVGDFRNAALRAVNAGYRFIEIHAAHGYLLHSFLSPLSNQRSDEYGGSLANRMRFPLEVVATVRAAVPEDLPLSVRISVVDGVEGGWSLHDSVELSRRLKDIGVDIVDCSSGGIRGPATAGKGSQAIPRRPGFQVPFAHAIKSQADIPTIAVGLIVDAHQAEKVLEERNADLIAIGREALFNPNWPLHARLELELDSSYSSWPQQYGWWLRRRPKC